MKLIIFIILLSISLSLLIWGFFSLLSISKKNREAMDFIHDLSLLDACVKYGLVNDHSVKFIIEKFNEIEQNNLKDPQMIRELKDKFKQRYAEFLQDTSEY
jgi:hypothetical protein